MSAGERSPATPDAPDTGGQGASPEADLAAVVERGRGFELGGGYVLPPGDPVSHFGAGFAKTLASNIFITGLEPDFAAAHTGYFTAPYEHRHHATGMEVDAVHRTVRVSLDNGVTREARILGGQGAVAVPLGADDVSFTPRAVPKDLAAGPLALDAGPTDGVDAAALERALDHAFEARAMTAAFVVAHRGRVIAERYRDGIGAHTPLESWSMGKSLTATLLGLLVARGVYALDAPAPIPEWQSPGDPRAAIRIRDIMQMSSGLRFRAMQDPDYEPALGYPDHLYVYTGGVDAFEFVASREPQWPPGTVGRYRNVDPGLANYLVRLGVEALGEDYLTFPQRALFDPLGMGDMVVETDPFGNFLLQGYELGSARDWARLGQLYLDDGMIDGGRLLPAGWTRFVSTLAPAWVADGRPVYGGFFWVNGDRQFSIPAEAYYMAGAGGQRTFVIPSHDLVVVRIGHYGGAEHATAPLDRALAALMRAVPRRE